MPVYEAFCHKCGKVEDYVRKAADYLNTPECCGQKMEKMIFSPPMGYCENIHYQSPITGQPITTKQQRIEDLRRSNSRPWEGLEQEKKEAARSAQYAEQEADKKIEKAVVQAWQTLSPEKQAVLSESAGAVS